MKYILLVDDQELKASDVKAAVENAALSAIHIDTAVSVNEAREHLRVRKYDLLILDLALPIVVGTAASPDGGMLLLEDIDKTDTLIKPGFVVGLTAFTDLQDKFRDQFASRLWSLEVYEAAIGLWRIHLAAKVRYLTGRSTPNYQTDVCIITALESELDAVMSWGADWRAPEALDETTFVYSGTLPSANGPIEIHAAACSRKGMVAAALLTTKLIFEFSPRLILMPGICAGKPKKADIGDVLVADPCWNWQDGRIEPADTLFSPHQLDLAPELQARVRVLMRDNQLGKNACDAFAGEKPDRIPKIILGPVATGSSVIADKSILPTIARQNRDLIGVEMESYGVYAAALDARSPKPLCMAMKSVCDFGDEHKDNKYQKFAAHMSGYVTREFISRFSGEIKKLL